MEPSAIVLPSAPPADVPSPPKPPYSLPWQLRPAGPSTAVRSDTTAAFFQDPVSGSHGSAVASMLLGSYKVTDQFAPLVRLGLVSYSPPAGTGGKAAFVNPVIGGIYGFKLSAEIKAALFLGLTVPVGQGGGDTPDPNVAAAVTSGILARSAMDNAMFAVNYFAVFPGADIAYVSGGLTVQVEATVYQLVRVRGANAKSSRDASRTNLTTGIHVGYFVVPILSFGAELRYQVWLANASVPTDLATRDNLSFAVGPRLHWQLGDSVWFRPGVAYALGIDDPMSAQKYNIVQLDLPMTF